MICKEGASERGGRRMRRGAREKGWYTEVIAEGTVVVHGSAKLFGG